VFRAPKAQTFEMQARLPTPLDVLVVLDDTPAMASRLPPPGVDQLSILPLIYNGAPELRIAVTTGTSGELRTTAALPTGILEQAIDLTDGSLQTSYTGSLQTATDSLTNVGAASTGPNALLAAAQRALATPGFVRDGDAVGIFIVTAGDDASLGSPLDYAAAIQMPGNPTMVSVVDAVPTQRLGAFADALPHRSEMAMSAYDMEALTVFSSLFRDDETGDICLPITAAATNGQYDCDIFGSYNHVVSPLPACMGDPWQASVTCWQISVEPSCGSGQMLLLGGPFTRNRPHVIGRCAT